MPARISSFAKDATRVLLVDFIEQRLKCDPVARRIFRMEEKAALHLDAHAEEQILIGHVQAITGEANQIFRRFSGAGYGIDGEIEFKDNDGEPSGKKIYVQLKNGNSHRRSRRDGRDFFDVTTTAASNIGSASRWTCISSSARRTNARASRPFAG